MQRFLSVPLLLFDEIEEDGKSIYNLERCLQIEGEINPLSIESFYPDIPPFLDFNTENFLYTTVEMKSGAKHCVCMSITDFRYALKTWLSA